MIKNAIITRLSPRCKMHVTIFIQLLALIKIEWSEINEY